MTRLMKKSLNERNDLAVVLDEDTDDKCEKALDKHYKIVVPMLFTYSIDCPCFLANLALILSVLFGVSNKGSIRILHVSMYNRAIDPNSYVVFEGLNVIIV